MEPIQNDVHEGTSMETAFDEPGEKGKMMMDKQIYIQTGKEPSSCTECGKVFTQRIHLTNHMRTHTGEKPFSCKDCGRAFTERSNLIKHMRTHTGEKPFHCNDCGNSFTHRSILTKHLKTHTGEKPFSCKDCGKAFIERSSLTKHMRTHTGEKPFSCKDCGKAFTDKRNLTRHMRTHTGEKPFNCTECGNLFTHNSSLKQHMRTHTGEKRFSCKDCGKAFTDKRNLTKHMRTHIGGESFSCKEYGENLGVHKEGDISEEIPSDTETGAREAFHSNEEIILKEEQKDWVSYDEHGMELEEKKPFRCTECGHLFTHQSSLTQHMRTHTGQKPFNCKEYGENFDVHKEGNMNEEEEEEIPSETETGARVDFPSCLEVILKEEPKEWVSCDEHETKLEDEKDPLVLNSGNCSNSLDEGGLLKKEIQLPDSDEIYIKHEMPSVSEEEVHII